MNILVIFTGGTIGSQAVDGFITPAEEQRYMLLEEYRKISPCHILYNGVYADAEGSDSRDTLYIQTEEPYQILSENLSGEYLNRLIACIRRGLDDTYDGIIVTHGTDTLQYTAAALGYVFANADIPIVMVSSNYILDDVRANGLDNFYYAVEFIKYCMLEKTGSGVFVSYRNGEDRQLIHRATRLLPHAPYEDLVHSINNRYYGEFITDRFVFNADSVINLRDEVTQPVNLPCLTDVTLSTLAPVLYIPALPGQSYPDIKPNIRAILLDTYHSGTLCTEAQGLKDFIRQAKTASKALPVFLTGAIGGTSNASENSAYASTKAYKELGIQVLPKASPIAMYMKLWLLLCLQPEISASALLSFMGTEYAFDIVT